jgi:voltage-gated potassium channel
VTVSAPPASRAGAAGGPTRSLVDCPEEDLPLTRARRVRQLDAGSRERWAQVVSTRLDLPMSVLGLIFLLVVLGQTVAGSPAVQRPLTAVSWLLWLVFVSEFLLRLWVAPSRRRFLRRNWWQVVFLALPMLRFVRLVLVLRAARAGRVVSSAVRSSRSAGRVMSDRLAWLAAVSVILILSASQLLFAFEVFDDYGDALHAAALATISGQPMGQDDGLAQVLDVLLAIWSVGVFAALAGTLGAYFLEGRREAGARASQPAAG